MKSKNYFKVLLLGNYCCVAENDNWNNFPTSTRHQMGDVFYYNSIFTNILRRCVRVRSNLQNIYRLFHKEME